jgi:reverse transcriptase-like protein
MGKLDTVTVNGPEGDVLDWDAVDWRQVEDDVRRLRQRIFTATQAGEAVNQHFCIPDLDAFRACLSPVRLTAHAGF